MEHICPECKAQVLLPPAAPFVMRMAEVGHLHFALHGEDGGKVIDSRVVEAAKSVRRRPPAVADGPSRREPRLARRSRLAVTRVG